MTEYKTVEGHEIFRDGEYETRDGEKAVVLGFIPVDHAYYSVIGYCKFTFAAWNIRGCDGLLISNDLMRPWEEKKVCDYCKEPYKRVSGHLCRKKIKDDDRKAREFYQRQPAWNFGWPEEEGPDPWVIGGFSGEKEKKKTYKLSEMWKVWVKYIDDEIRTFVFLHEVDAGLFASKTVTAIAITRADATEFYEGEGLDGKDG